MQQNELSFLFHWLIRFLRLLEFVFAFLFAISKAFEISISNPFSHLPIEKLLFFRSYLRHYQSYYQSAIIVSLLPEYEEEGDQLEDSTLDNNAFALNTPLDAEDSDYGS